MTYNVVSLFSGAGGLDLGFKNAGFNISWANDFEKDAVYTYSKNIGNHIRQGDIRNISSDNIPNNPDIILGGFPCQGFSICNKNRSMQDSRNFLYLELLRVVKDKQPQFFVAENVKGLLSMENGEVINMIVGDFEDLGYSVDYKILNAAEYGVPQLRERVIIIGNRIGVNNPYPLKTHYILNKVPGLKPAITVETAIGYLQNIPLSYNPININDTTIYNHTASTNVKDKFFARKYDIKQSDICDYLTEWKNKSHLTVSKIDEYFGYKYTAGHWFRKDSSGSIPSPEDWLKLKEILHFDDKYDNQVTTLEEKNITFDQSLRITNWDRPSDTITATCPEIHVNKQRRLSVRECAILQSFPNNFIFYGSLNSMYRQVGNAVPPLLAEKMEKKF